MVAEQVPQCGYCQSGQIMAAAALLKRIPIQQTRILIMRWWEIFVVAELIPRIRKAIKTAAQMMAKASN
jgi:isoquinoline 1-oxidoreductase alpha subunit